MHVRACACVRKRARAREGEREFMHAYYDESGCACRDVHAVCMRTPVHVSVCPRVPRTGRIHGCASSTLMTNQVSTENEKTLKVKRLACRERG
eukprot:1560910-Pleurochrysis_carterae.AAC.1